MQYSILLDKLPPAAETLKTRSPQRQRIIGEAVNDSGFVEALERFGQFRQCFYIASSEECRRGRSSDLDNRFTAITANSLSTLDDCGPLILFTSSPLFQRFACFRSALKHREWPICGLTHTLSNGLTIDGPRLFSYDALICTTASAKEAVARTFAQRAKSTVVTYKPELPQIRYPVIPLGVHKEMVGDPTRRDVERKELGFQDDEFVILSIGRLSPFNKAELFPIISTFFLATGLPDNSCLILAGDDTQHSIATELEEFGRNFESSRQLLIRPNLTLSEKRQLLSIADVFLAISDTIEETFGISVIEAMMSGLPVIASDWDGYRHLIRDRQHGVLIPTSMMADDGLELNALSPLLSLDYHLRQRIMVDIESLGRAMCLMSTHATARQELGRAAKLRAESEFSWNVVLGRYENLWIDQLREADGACRSTEGRDVYHHPAFSDLLAAFNHYPSTLISMQRRVEFRSDPACLEGLLNRGKLYQTDSIEMAISVDQRLLEHIRRINKPSLHHLVAQMHDLAVHPVVIVSHVCRLVKNGVLRWCEET